MSEQRLKELGLTLPDVPTPVATYVPFKRHGDVAYLSGVGPRDPDGSHRLGKVGADVTTKDAYDHARLAGLNLLAVMRVAAGSLDKVEVLKLLGMVNATPEFKEQPQVINGCSDLLEEVLGERGRHARSAVGFGSLPNGMTVEIEAIIRILP